MHRSSTKSEKRCETEGRRSSMPKWLHARQPLDETEHRLVRKVTTSRHAPADWVWHAQMIARSWDGARTSTIAAELGCSRPTRRQRVHALPDPREAAVRPKPPRARRPRL